MTRKAHTGEACLHAEGHQGCRRYLMVGERPGMGSPSEPPGGSPLPTPWLRLQDSRLGEHQPLVLSRMVYGT